MISDPGNSGATSQNLAEDIHNRTEEETLAERAVRLAGYHSIETRSERHVRLLTRVNTIKILVHDEYLLFARLSELDDVQSYAAEWILDNYYIIQQAIRQFEEDMPEKFYRELPKLGATSFAGFPRVYAITQDLVTQLESRVNIEALEEYINAYQTVSPLTIGEVWALPSMLRFTILESLARASAQALDIQTLDETALGMASSSDVSADTIVANAVSSLRIIASQDWKTFFEHTSVVENIFAQDPAAVYHRMDFESRDIYRNAVERLAVRTGVAEAEIALQAVRLARAAGSGNGHSPRRSHVGYYLIDQGMPELEASLGYTPAGKDRINQWLAAHPAVSYLGSISTITLLMLAVLWMVAQSLGASTFQVFITLLAGLVPASFLAVSAANWFFTRSSPPRLLPKLDFKDGIPADYRTLIVIPALLTDREESNSILHQIELHYLRNPHDNLAFALLTDFPDADQQNQPDDEALLAHIIEGIQALQQRFQQAGQPERFFLLHRERQWNSSEGIWMGWERKRGKLEELNHLLLGKIDSSFTHIIGDIQSIRPVRYIITLDADTLLPQGSAARLIGAMAHPLAVADLDDKTGKVTAGYTVLQPRTQIKPASALRTRFSMIFSGDTTVDLYTLAVSDVYQDLFGEGIYVGKGIYDLQAFSRCLTDRIPENSLLSHDLLEGLLGRAGLVSDVVLYEEFPTSYLAYAHRQHRWIRGDWQLLPWLLSFKRVRQSKPLALDVIDRWKIFDNLRRSLYAPSLLLLLLLGWFWLPGPPLLWTALVLLISASPLLTSLNGATIRRLRHTLAMGLNQPERMQATNWLLNLAFLVNDTRTAASAITRTLWRLLVSKKNLLEWTTSARVDQVFGRVENRNLQVWRDLGISPVFALVIFALLAIFRPSALPAALPLLVGWAVAPQLAIWSSLPVQVSPPALKKESIQRLRSLARRTWYFFEQFVGPVDHWLPPDNFQEVPRGIVAHRTSPTNIGLGLLTNLASYDLGYTDLQDMVLRISSMLDTLENMQMYRGHWLNWYDTRSLEPLPPRYISTVDSGNLAGAMLCLRQGMRDVLHEPYPYARGWDGLEDTINTFNDSLLALKTQDLPKTVLQSIDKLSDSILDICEQIGNHKADPLKTASLLDDLSVRDWPTIEQKLVSIIDLAGSDLDPALLRSLRQWAERVRFSFTLIHRDQENRMPWLRQFASAPGFFIQSSPDSALGQAWSDFYASASRPLSLTELAGAVPQIQDELALLRRRLEELPNLPEDQRKAGLEWCQALYNDLSQADIPAQVLIQNIHSIADRLDQIVQAMDFSFLMNEKRNVFHIGYNLDTEQMDNNFYDLLASEARIASLVAIAKHDVPIRHWLHMGRPVTQVDNRLVLLSWSGTMFEYLMPTLLMREFPNTLLSESSLGAIRQQIAYGQEKGVPWGISESGFYFFDAHQNYQYRAFGVPGLGFKRGLSDDLVIAPYASLLALPFAPQEVVKNMQKLDQLQMLTDYGYYEAVDFTPEHMLLGQEHALVREFMAHHQGMIMLQLANYLQDQRFVNRFHNSSRIQSVEMLLQEQVSDDVPLERMAEKDEEPHGAGFTAAQDLTNPWRSPSYTTAPFAHYLSNGRYSLLITNKGSGYSRWEDIDLTRWRADATLDDWGTWIYIQDLESGDYFTATPHLEASGSSPHEVSISPHRVDFHVSSAGINSHLFVAVSPDDDVEVRQLRLSNQTDQPRRVAVASYGEVLLTSLDADRRHPAFNKLLIESEWHAPLNALIFHRRPRAAKEAPVVFLHMLLPVNAEESSVQYQTSRMDFIGRGRTLRSPAALEMQQSRPQGAAGYVLDPIFSLREEVEIPAHGSVELVYLTLAAPSRQKAMELARRYQDPSRLDRIADQARYAAEVELRRLGINSPDLEQYQKLLSVLFYPQMLLRADPAELAKNQRGQPSLWAYGISGDYPIVLVKISGKEDVSILRDLLRAHTYWRSRGLLIDLVIINEKESGYSQEVHNRLFQLLLRTNNDTWLNRRGGIFLLRWDSTSVEDQVLLNTTARAILTSSGGTLQDQLPAEYRLPVSLPAFLPIAEVKAVDEPGLPVKRPEKLLFDNGFGGFSLDGREYIIYLEPGQVTPAPWINVIANEQAGFWVSESGGGYTWAVNSGENRLTPWSNDPVSDQPGEAIYIRDEETAEVWSPTPAPIGAAVPYLVRHGAGYTIFEHNAHGLAHELRLFVPPDDPLKIAHLRLHNTMNHTRRITITYYAEWVLGVNRDQMAPYIIPEYDYEQYALLARNPYQVEFAERIAFLAAGIQPHGFTADRTEFLGRNGSYQAPAALSRVGLSGAVSAGSDPCAAIMVHVDIQPGDTQDLFFLLGQGADRADTQRIIAKYNQLEAVRAAFDQARDRWNQLLDTIQISTPDSAMDTILNRWLLYQNLSCRIWGRSALYQSSGAFGFRDQLQDVMALIYTDPEITRSQILNAAQYQFEQGDVLHWWHPPSGRGVRTRHSDDLLWLPYVTLEYLLATGDHAILEEQIPFLTGDELRDEEEDRYGFYPQTETAYSLYEHCKRAILRGSTRGPHGLPLIGTGDWNDGMNRVGVEGKGESIWLGWFLYGILMRFAPVCRLAGDDLQAESFLQQASDLRDALHKSGWDGEWYLRGFFDDGSPLGSRRSEECKIDSIAQSWAILSGAGEADRDRMAMRSVLKHLVQSDGQLLRLFRPPFNRTSKDPGYIKSYPPGVRENGGQYTHAAIWSVWAYTVLGDGDTAGKLFHMLNPINHGSTPAETAMYKVEPYVIAADVYSEPPHTGQGGWTWYTGSGGWMYRLGIQAILGLQRLGDRLVVDPCIPRDWAEYRIRYRYGSTWYDIHVQNPDQASTGIASVQLDQIDQADLFITLVDDGQTHNVLIRMAAEGKRPEISPDHILNGGSR